jgi:hypothetical protein
MGRAIESRQGGSFKKINVLLYGHLGQSFDYLENQKCLKLCRTPVLPVPQQKNLILYKHSFITLVL